MEREILTAVREALLAKGYTLSGWARENGYEPEYVVQNLCRYSKKQALPKSPVVYGLLTSIYKETGVNLMKTNLEIVDMFVE